MLGGSVTFLVSLYFDWLNAASCFSRSECYPSGYPGAITSSWTGSGQIAAVLAIALAAGAIAAAVDQELATRLPVGQVAIALGIFALLSISERWVDAVSYPAGRFPVNGLGQFTVIGLGPGAYIGLGGVAVAGAGAALARWGGITRPRHVVAAAGTLITLALIASFVLPALDASGTPTFDSDRAAFICVFACLGLLAWRGHRPGPRLATAVAIGTLVAARLLPLRHDYTEWPYELWLQLACAAGLLVLGLVCSRDLPLRRPSLSELTIVVGSVLLLVSLFLPWQSYRDGGYYEQRGWSTAGLAGMFSLGLLVTLVWVGRFVRELAIGAAIFVLAAGLVTATTSIPASFPASPHRPKAAPFILRFEYGALLGFAGVALLLVVALGRFRPIPAKRFLVGLVPAVAALALLSLEVAPHVSTLFDLVNHTNLFAIQSPFAPLELLGAIASLLTLRLILRWLDGPRDSAEVVGVPLALLALTVLAVIHGAIVTTTLAPIGFTYGKGISWEGWVAIFLCLLLVACGWVERGGLGRFQAGKETGHIDPRSELTT